MLSVAAWNASVMNVLLSESVPVDGKVTPGAGWQNSPGWLSLFGFCRWAAQMVSQSSTPLLVTPVGSVLAWASPSSWKNWVLWTACAPATMNSAANATRRMGTNRKRRLFLLPLGPKIRVAITRSSSADCKDMTHKQPPARYHQTDVFVRS